ncbi:MAG: hypothetical protein ACXU86_18850 [Archangium sp.]
MKVLELYGMKPEDSLLLIFDGAFSPQAARESELEPCFQALEEYADGWMPDIVKGKRQRKYARAAVWRALEERGGERYTHCGLYRAQWPALAMSLGLYLPPLLPRLDILIKVKPLSFFAEAERCRHFVPPLADRLVLLLVRRHDTPRRLQRRSILVRFQIQL